MKLNMGPRVIITLALAIITFAAGTVRAQDIVPGASRQPLGNSAPGPRPPKRPTRKYGSTPPRVRTLVKEVKVMPTTGTLFISTESKAAIVVEPVGGGESEESLIPNGERFFIFTDLKPGSYRVAAALDGYRSVEKTVTIERNTATGVTLDLKPITYTAFIRTNVPAGRILYAPVEAYTDVATGKEKYRPIGATTQVRIENRRAELTNLRKGTYGVDIKADEVGYETLLATISVPDESNKDTVALDVELKNIRSTAPFSAMTGDQWDLPPGWSIAPQMISVRGRGVALPRLENYRHYQDFQLISNVRMRNGVAISFVARAADKENFYLIQLTGANAQVPFQLRGLIVRKGVLLSFGSIPIYHLADTINPKRNFEVLMKVTGYRIDVKVRNSQTGELTSLGILTDSNGNFPSGAVGIAADDKEENDLGSFLVCTPECPRQ